MPLHAGYQSARMRAIRARARNEARQRDATARMYDRGDSGPPPRFYEPMIGSRTVPGRGAPSVPQAPYLQRVPYSMGIIGPPGRMRAWKPTWTYSERPRRDLWKHLRTNVRLGGWRTAMGQPQKVKSFMKFTHPESIPQSKAGGYKAVFKQYVADTKKLTMKFNKIIKQRMALVEGRPSRINFWTR